MKFKIRDWRPRRSGQFYGKVEVIFDDYLSVTLSVMQGKNGLWASMPTNKWMDRQGKAHYDRLVEFADADLSKRFQQALISTLLQKFPSDFVDQVAAVS